MENRCGFNPVDSNADRYAKTLQLQSFFSRLILIFSLLFLTSCGSSGSGSGSGAEMITGQFIDDPVAGLVYRCSSGNISETTADGEFTCPIGDDVSFYLGSTQLGPIPAANSFITPYSLFPGDLTAATNLAILLQSIASDELSGNGSIVIDVALVDLLPADIIFSDPTFVDDLQAALSITLITADEARQYLDESIAQFVSDDANLSELTLSDGTLSPVFNASISTYLVSVENAVTTIDVTPTVAEVNATISINGVELTSGSSRAVSLGVGTNVIPIVVRTADGATIKTYTVTVTREAASSDANLSSLILSDGTLSPVFNTSTISYTASVINAVSTIDVTPTVAEANATISINGISISSGSPRAVSLGVGENIIPVSVTAADGNTNKIYTVTVTREAASNDANLSSLILSDGTLSPVFNASTISYTASVGNTVTTIDVTSTVAEANATISIDGISISSGSPRAVLLGVGENIIPVSVTAEDGTTSKTYTITVTRQDVQNSSDATLQDLRFGPIVPAGILTPTFNSAITSYTATVDNIYATLTIVPTATNSNSTITVSADGRVIPVNNGASSGAIGLIVGNNFMSVVVVAEAGNSKIYSLAVTRLEAPPEIPLAPQNLQATVADSETDLSWSWVSEADNYTVYWNTTGNVTTSDNSIDAGNSNQLTHTSLINETTYYYRVSASNISGEGDLSTETFVVPTALVIPSAPTGLQALVGDAQATLSWSAMTGADSYTLYWNISGDVTTSDTSIDMAAGTLYVHTGLTAGTTYYYRVSATNTLGEGELSAQASSSQQAVWQWANPTPDGNTFYNFAWGNNTFVGVTSGGGIYTSSDAISWVKQNSGTSESLWDIVWNGSQFITVGNGGLVLTSTDGAVWTVISSGVGQNLGEIIWTGNQFLMVGYPGIIMTSPDGLDWTNRFSLATAFANLHDAIWTGSQFVVYQAGSSGNFIHTSPDGVIWSSQSTTLNINPIVSDGSQYLTLSGTSVLTSPDGVNWTEIGTTNGSLNGALIDLIWDGSQFVGAGTNGFITTSPDGLNWTTQVTNSTSDRLEGIVWNGSLYVAGGSEGTILTSPDAEIWTQRLPTTSITEEALNDIVWNGSQFVAVGYTGTIITSPDGDNWTVRTSNTTQTLWSIIWNSIQSKFIVVGAGSTILTSADGVTWDSRDSGTTSKNFKGIAWDGSQFAVVGGYQVVVTSADGVTWATHAIATTVGFNAVSWNDSLFVAVGGYNTGKNIMTSPDGENWTAYASNIQRLDDVVWANNQFVATGQIGVTHTSPDGLIWTSHYNNISGYLIHVNWDGSQYVACNAEGPVYTSPDGVDWTGQNTGSGNWLDALTWNGDGKAVGVGLSGTIITNASW